MNNNIWQRIFPFSKKESQARIVSNITKVGQPQMTPANFMGFTREGFQKNAIVFKCVSLIATACAGIEWELYQGKGAKKREIEDHPLLDLLAKPNPMQAQSSFFEYLVAYLKLTGNSYVETVKIGRGEVRELWPVRPDMMKIIPGANGFPAFYQFTSNQNSKKWPVNPIDFTSDIMHVKTFHPANDWYGMSPIEAAMLSVDAHNASSKWNIGLLQNSATPAGVLQMKTTEGNPNGTLTEEQYERIKNEFENAHMGAKNAGRPLILEGGLNWTSISMNPKDLEFMKGREMTAGEIALVFGVPMEMLGMGQKTYSNYAEARMAFYEETVLPTLDMVRDELNRALTPLFGDQLCLEYDPDDIEALAPKRNAVFTMIQNANFITQNEKRAMTGFEEIEGMDVFVIGSQIIDPAAPQPDPNATPNQNPNDPNNQDQGDGGDNGDNQDNQNEAQNVDETRQSGKGAKKITSKIETFNADDDKNGWKSFNPINRNERKASWKAQNARRERLATPFEKDLKSDLYDLSKAISNAAKGKHDPQIAKFAMTKASGEHMAEISKTIKRHLKYVMDDFGSMIFNEAKHAFQIQIEKKSNLKYEQYVDAYIQKRTAKSITEIEGTTKKQIERIVKRLVADNIDNGDTNADLSGDLQDEFDALTPGRARTIARTEVAMASNNASLNAVKSLQIPHLVKEWNSIQDDRTRDGDGPNPGNGANHYDMNGVQVPLDEKFTVPPDTDMDGPGDDSAGADQVCNCRCVLTYSQKGRNDGTGED